MNTDGDFHKATVKADFYKYKLSHRLSGGKAFYKLIVTIQASPKENKII